MLSAAIDNSYTNLDKFSPENVVSILDKAYKGYERLERNFTGRLGKFDYENASILIVKTDKLFEVFFTASATSMHTYRFRNGQYLNGKFLPKNSQAEELLTWLDGQVAAT